MNVKMQQVLSFASARFYREFSGNLVVRIQGFHCGLGSIPGGGTKISQAGLHGPEKPKIKKPKALVVSVIS